MDAVAESTLTGAASGAMAGATLGPVGALVGGVVGGGIGYFQGKKAKKENAAIAVEEAKLTEQQNQLTTAQAAEGYKQKQLEQWNAADSQDNSYDNDQYSDMAGTNTLPVSGASKVPVTATPQTSSISTLTSSDAQLKALGVIS